MTAAETADGLREQMHAMARALNEHAAPGLTWDTPAPAGANRPGDDFNRRASWEDVLQPHGWSLMMTRGETGYWRRPGKEGKVWSATAGHCKSPDGMPLLHVFSGSVPPFEPERTYTKFAAYCLLNHSGDYKAAARALAGKGYGEQRQQTKPHEANGKAPAEPKKPEEEEPPDVDPDSIATIHDLIRAGAQVAWTWKDWIQTGVLTAIAAKGGTGKTRFCADLVRRIRHQLPWPDGQPMTLPPDSIALWLVADNHHDEMVSLAQSFDIVDNIRLNATKADPYGGVVLESPEDYRDLHGRVKACKPALVIIDTVGNATDKNLSKQEDAKAFYWPLQIMARKNRTAILCLTHLNASGQFLGRRVLEKVRVALRMDQYEGEERRRLEVHKTNSKRPPAIGVTMGEAGNEYDSNPPEPPSDSQFGKPAISAKLQEAMAWLTDHLSIGPKRVSYTRDAANKAGIAPGTLYRAKEMLLLEEFEAEGYKWWRFTNSIPD